MAEGRKHILHVIGTISPQAGGPSDAVLALLEFAPEGATGEIVTVDDPGAEFLKAIPFPVHALGPQKTGFGYSGKLLGWLKANVGRFDGVVVHGMWQYCGYAAWRACRAAGVPYMVFSHGMLDPYFKREFPAKHAKKWVYWLLSEYWVLRGARRVLFTTTEEAKLAEQSFWLHRWRGEVVPFGANRPPEGRTETELREAFYGQAPALRGRRFVLFLGRIHRKKGCDLLVKAFAGVAAKDPELELVMAGPDQQGWMPELKAMAAEAGVSERVHWPGMLKGDVKWGAFFASEVFALTSHQENFGIAVAESLACGRPVLLCDKVNIAGEIAADGAGLVEPDTQAGADALLEQWVGMPVETKAAMGEQARKTFAERYDMRRNAAVVVGLVGYSSSKKTRPKL